MLVLVFKFTGFWMLLTVFEVFIVHGVFGMFRAMSNLFFIFIPISREPKNCFEEIFVINLHVLLV